MAAAAVALMQSDESCLDAHCSRFTFHGGDVKSRISWKQYQNDDGNVQLMTVQPTKVRKATGCAPALCNFVFREYAMRHRADFLTDAERMPNDRHVISTSFSCLPIDAIQPKSATHIRFHSEVDVMLQRRHLDAIVK